MTWENLWEILWVLKDTASLDLPPAAKKVIDLEGRAVKDGEGDHGQTDRPCRFRPCHLRIPERNDDWSSGLLSPVIAMTGTSPPPERSKERISCSSRNPSLPGIAISEITRAG
jgi:hypothetical protein